MQAFLSRQLSTKVSSFVGGREPGETNDATGGGSSSCNTQPFSANSDRRQTSSTAEFHVHQYRSFRLPHRPVTHRQTSEGPTRPNSSSALRYEHEFVSKMGPVNVVEDLVDDIASGVADVYRTIRAEAANQLSNVHRRTASVRANPAAAISQTQRQTKLAISKVVNRVASFRSAVLSNASSESVSSSNDGEDDQVVHEFQERLEIVEKYDKGCKGQQVDPWENPDFELYKITDRYGFMHNDAILLDEDEQRAKMMELKRENKWLKMIQDWHKYEDSLKLRRRIFKGVPDKFRAEVWRRLLELDTNKQENIYEQLKLRARLVSKDLKQIDLDINRTYRNHLFFRRRYDLKQQSLFHVLAAYAMFNTQVGYCQGMSQVAAVLLMYFDEEDAFWALHTLMCDEAHAMHGFFVPGFPKLLRFQQHHDRVLKKMVPRLKKHIDKHEIHSALYTTKWFFQCFLDRVPFTLALRLWDLFIMDGDVVLSGMAYNIMKVHQKRLLKLNFEQTMEFLQIQLEQYFGFPNDVTIEHLRASMAELRRAKLLEAPPPDKASEKASKPFGEILKTPYDELKRSLSVALSRKGRSSRSPSFSSSLPVTPRHRSTSPNKSAAGPVTLAPVEPPAAAKLLHRQPLPQVNSLVPTASRQQYQDLSSPAPTTSSPNTSGGSSTTLETNGDVLSSRRMQASNKAGSAVGGPDAYRQQEWKADARHHPARYFTSEGDRDLSTSGHRSPASPVPIAGTGLRHTESFYDNVPGADKTASQECMEYDAGRNQYGGVTYTTQYTRTTETVTTSRRREHLVNDAYAIRTGPDHVTRIEVGDNDSCHGKGHSPRTQVQYSPGGRPARFPVGLDELKRGRNDSPIRGIRKSPPPDY